MSQLIQEIQEFINNLVLNKHIKDGINNILIELKSTKLTYAIDYIVEEDKCIIDGGEENKCKNI